MDACEPSIRNRTAQSIWTRPRSPDNRNSAELEIARRIAGENRHGDADQGLKWNLYAIAHPTVAGNPPEVNYSGGATARGGGGDTANTATALRRNRGQMGATPSISGIPGTLRHDPELLGSPEAGWRRRSRKRARSIRAELS